MLFVGRGRLALPLEPWLRAKWDALSDELDLRVLNAGSGGGDDRFRLLPERASGFYPRLPFAVAAELRRFPADAIVASDPYVGVAARAGRALARSHAKLIVEVHGDPQTLTRSYGSSARRVVSPLADRTARAGIAGADATRALSAFTSSLVEAVRGEPATASFPTYSDLSAFADPEPLPVPDGRRVVFVGALEAYKNVDGLAAAWRAVVRKLPDATLTIVGDGARRNVVERLVADLPENVVHEPRLPPGQVVNEIDAARALVLPSWPEGLGRVVLEAFARGRAVIGTNGGGIPDIVTDDVDGILIPKADMPALVEALERVLTDDELCARLGEAARVAYARWHQTPQDFARAYRELVDCALAGAS